MAIKYKITKDEFAKLNKVLQAEYKANEAGDEYTADVEGIDDGSELKGALENERKETKKLKKSLTDKDTELANITTERDNLLKGTVPKDNVTALENSFKEKQTKLETEKNAQIDTLTKQIRKSLVDNVASELATEISTAPSLLLPHIKSRLVAEADADGNYVTKVLDKDGKPSVFTIADLKKEFLANKDFSAVLIGSKGSGGGAGGSRSGGGAKTQGVKVDSKASPSEIMAGMLERGSVVDLPNG